MSADALGDLLGASKCDAGSSVMELFGSCLRAACRRLGKPKQGLASAAGELYGCGFICSKTRTHLIELDTAFQFVRHATVENNNVFSASPCHELANGDGQARFSGRLYGNASGSETEVANTPRLDPTDGCANFA